MGQSSAMLSLIGDQKKFLLFVCICIAVAKTACAERRSDLMEVPILKRNKKNVLSRLSAIPPHLQNLTPFSEQC